MPVRFAIFQLSQKHYWENLRIADHNCRFCVLKTIFSFGGALRKKLHENSRTAFQNIEAVFERFSRKRHTFFQEYRL